jgi:Adaptin C-terminal domain
MDLLGGLQPTASAQPANPQAAPNKQVDLLGDLFGNSKPVVATPAPKVDPLADLFGSSAKTSTPSTTGKVYTCYDKNGFKITLTPVRESSQVVSILVHFHNISASGPVSGISFQVAVPKVRLMC